MRITIQNTSKIVEIHSNPTPARVWEGVTERGVKVQCLVTRIAALSSDDLAEFEAELQEQSAPSAQVSAFPARLIL